MDGRLKRRTAGALKAGLGKLRQVRLADPRSRQNRRWGLWQLLNAALVGLCAGMHGLSEVEQLTGELSSAMRKMLGLGRRVPDTTLRDVLVRLQPNVLRSLLWHQVRCAHRQKALKPVELPFGIAGVDGKCSALNSWGCGYAQRQVHGGSARGASGLLRTYTGVLISAPVPVCLDAPVVPAETNEDGYFRTFIDELLELYGHLDLFRMIIADAGACALANAKHVCRKKLHYCFTLNEKQPTLLKEAVRLLGSMTDDEAVASTSEAARGGIEERLLFITTEMAAFMDWSELRTTIRIQRTRWDARGKVEFIHNRYFISSLAEDRLTKDQWLGLIRRYWASVESGCHNTLDVAFEEDRHPWITDHDRGALNVMILRRIAYYLLALFRGVTQRSEEGRTTPWARVLDWFYQILIAATEQQTAGLRPRAATALVP